MTESLGKILFIMKMTHSKAISILLMDKNYMLKKMAKQLPGVPGAVEKEELPGLPGVKEEEDPFKKGFMEGYEAGLKDAMTKMDTDDDDDDEEDMNANKVPKSEKTVFKLIHSMVKKMFSSQVQSQSSPLYSEANGVSIITIDGELDKRTSEPGKVDVDVIVKALKIAEKANTSAVILHINSPGGCSIGIQETGDVIKRLAVTKPVFTFVDTLCASAGYWLASCTNGIFVTPSSELGSIGVFAMVMDFSENLKQNGFNPQIFAAGDFKTMGHGERPLNEKEKEFITNDIDKQNLKFKTLVSANRGGVDDSVMQGQLFSGEEAVGNNLADEIVSDFDDVLNKLSTTE